MNTQEFAQTIKAKYPQYKGVDDATLVSKIVEKYPVYKSQISDMATDTVEQPQQGFAERVGTDIVNRSKEATRLSSESMDVNTPFATELRRRIESGQYNREINELGMSFPGVDTKTTEPQTTDMGGLNPLSGSRFDKSSTKETVSDIKQIGTDIKNSFIARKQEADATKAAAGEQNMLSTGLQAVGQSAGLVSDVAGDVVKGATKAILPQGAENAIKSAVTGVSNPIVQSTPVQSIVQKYNQLKETNPEAARNIDALLGIGSLTLDVAGLGAGEAGAQVAKQGAETAIKTGAKVAQDVASEVSSAAKPIVKTASKYIGTIEDAGTSFIKRIKEPDVSQNVKVSLNPFEALKDSGQDIEVSVGGKLKKLSEITPTQVTKIQSGTARVVDKFTEQAKKFANDRSVIGGSPVDIVSDRTDKALQFADIKRQAIGQKMGSIEEANATKQIPIGEHVYQAFGKVYNLTKENKFGISSKNPEVVKKFVEDFGWLDSIGAPVSERNSFVRTWSKYLEDQRDGFGKFKENSFENTQIQNAVNSIKSETVDELSKFDKQYRNLRKMYATYKELDEIGNKLLGQEGALGQRVKGSSIIKRAIQSNSDAGARQFLIKLRELTGYDAIKEGDLALVAMENAGDYQGLSLLKVIKEGKSGIWNKVIEKSSDFVAGDKRQRIKNYINKK